MENLSIYFNNLLSSEWAWGSVLNNLIIVTALLFIFKYIVALVSGVSVRDELAEKDNPAFGVTLGFSFLSYFLIMSAAATGDDLLTVKDEIYLMLSYGVSGMLILIISSFIFDKIGMKSFCINEQIRNRNVAAAIVSGGNQLATALIVFAYMGWVKGTSLQPILIVAYGWVLSQISLSIIGYIRVKMYKTDDGSTLQDAIKNGNVAVAIRYTAYKLSFALTALIAAPHYPYDQEDGWWMATAIFLSSILLAILIKLVASICKIVIIPKINYADEINNQQNTGLAFIEFCIVIGVTIAFYGLLR